MIRNLLLVSLLLTTGCNEILNRIGMRDLEIPKSHEVKRKGDAVDVPCSYKDVMPPHDGCVTAKITCDSTIQGETSAGRRNFEDDFYRAKFCQPFTYEYTGADRTYDLTIPAKTRAQIWLDSPCVDLDLIAFQWTYDGTCPTVNHLTSVCESDATKGGGHLELLTLDRPANYLVVVDGKQGVTGPFALTVECGPQ